MLMPSTSPCQMNCARSWAGTRGAGRSGARSRQVTSRTDVLLYWLVAGNWWLVSGVEIGKGLITRPDEASRGAFPGCPRPATSHQPPVNQVAVEYGGRRV